MSRSSSGGELRTPLVARAFFISLIAFLAVNAFAATLLVVERRELLPTLFETTSAFGTVGLSMGEAGRRSASSGALLGERQAAARGDDVHGAHRPADARGGARRGSGAQARIRYAEGRILVG